MARHIAFLRGMNVGAHHRVSNADLKSNFEALGFDAVAPFRTAGNVVFDTPTPLAQAVERIERRLARELAYDVAVYARTAAEIRKVSARRPFTTEQVEASKGKLQVVFLERKPAAKAARQVLAMATDDDCLALAGAELYWLPIGGTRETGLAWSEIAKLIGPSTTRTKGTVDLIAEKFFAS
jgi:uncharacterized protein (DUF1697 family)